VLVFVVIQRLRAPRAAARERHSVWWTNLAMLCGAIAMSWIFGVAAYLLIQLIVLAVAGAIGVWLFYVQHQFEDVYWERGGNWNYINAALQGSSFYKLPRVLQWFSGNIGFHHIHHLSARIPNYHLQKCHEADPLFQQVPALTLIDSLRTMRLALWDESSRKLVSFRQMKRARRGY
jgi:omega-6 fatty acid desaturase (delta-12 desaturase)